MKLIILLIAFTFSSLTFGATCTSISRSNYTTNQVLTSSSLNSDFNTVYAAANSLDGGCVTAGTLEYDALNTTQFAPLLKGVKEGCKVSYSSASQLSISKCLAAVNGNLVSTTVATTVSMACTNCSAEAASTVYYVYIATGSTGTTLTPLILTTAPNEDGYDNNGNRVLARFFNNSSSDIASGIVQWKVNSFDWDGATAHIKDVKSNTTNGGGSSAATQNVRTLNTLEDDFGIVTTLSSNQFTLPAGRYVVSATAPANQVGLHKLRLRNTTDSTTTIIGESTFSSSTSGTQTNAILNGSFEITAAKTFELQHYTQGAVATNGLGITISSGDSEVYAIVKITRVQ